MKNTSFCDVTPCNLIDILKFFWAVSHINVELKTVSEITVSIIRVDVETLVFNSNIDTADRLRRF